MRATSIYGILLVAAAVACTKPPGVSDEYTTSKTVDEIIKDAMSADIGQELDEDTVLVEMDMKMSKDRYNALYGTSNIDALKGLRDEKYRWSNKIIPYVIDDVFSDSEKKAIRLGMDEWEKHTCLKLLTRTDQANYVHIYSATGCWSRVGMEGGKQFLSLAKSGCIYHHTIVHELGHTVGMHHEQTRPDRDTFVTIITGNIQRGKEHNFQKYSTNTINVQGIKYDYWSVMHYGQYAFSGNGQTTIEPVAKDFSGVIGTVPGLSFQDIHLANKMYKCDAHCTNQCPAKAIRTKDCKCMCNTGQPSSPTKEWDRVSECKGGEDYNDPCIDFNTGCPAWEVQGECHSNTAWMLKNCRKSCKICGPGAICRDFNTYCDYWAKNGECEKLPTWMKLHCRKSCKVCS